MFGRKARRLAAADMGKTNARIASHFRRLQTASSPSRPAPFAVSSAILGSWDSRSLRHQNDVAVLEVEVLLLSSSDLVVIERDPRHGLAVGAKDDDPRAGRELSEPTSQGQGIQLRGPALEFVPRWAGDFPDDGHLEAANVRQDYGDFGRRHILGEALDQLVPQLHRCEARCLHVVQEWKRDHAVGPHGDCSGHGHILPYGYWRMVFGANPVRVRRAVATGIPL